MPAFSRRPPISSTSSSAAKSTIKNDIVPMIEMAANPECGAGMSRMMMMMMRNNTGWSPRGGSGALKIRMLAVSPFEDSVKSSTSWRPLQTSQGLALGSGRDLFQSPGQVNETFDTVGG